MLALPNVTLVLIDGTCPELAALALDDSMRQVDFPEVIVCSPTPPMRTDVRWIETSGWTNRQEPSKFIWYSLPNLIKTDFFLLIVWDAWIIDATQWSDEFLQYDYVGAPWWYEDGLNVGHGLLRSRRLMQFLGNHREHFPFDDPEDYALSRKYRPALEKEGFKWPSEQLAAKFMFECTKPSPDSKHFMFHDMCNFRRVLDVHRLKQRMELIRVNPYIIASHKEKLQQIESGTSPLPWIVPRLAMTPDVRPS